ncbi:MAG TPA: RNA polymerase sigma factor [Anaerolineaceae bacterium]
MPNLLLVDHIQAYSTRLNRFARSIVSDIDLAEDLVQETFIQALNHLDLLDRLNEHQRRAWFYQVLKNRCLDHLRQRKRQQALLQKMSELALTDDHSPDLAAEVGLFQRLPERFRDLLFERYVLGKTSEQIASGLGVPAATVRSRIRLAIEWLRVHSDEWME